MKKILFSLLVLCLLPVAVFAEGNGKVKVYMFEAGECPYCEMEAEYLKGLESYGTKFEIVSKELYVDHVTWAHGKDYDLGAKVSEEFKKAGFSKADYNATPFIVISNLYASTGYNTSLESIINEAYELGDTDVVGCIEAGNDNCMPEKEPQKINPWVIVSLVGVTVVVFGVIAGVSIHNDKLAQEETKKAKKRK